MDGNFGITVEHTGALGTSFRQLKLKDKTPADILSEGEQKIIALADFLTETKMTGINRGLIFDDPVNSLDSDRKQQIANKLVQESKERQIIIFTHDLVFYNCLFNASKTFLNGITNCFVHHTVEKESSARIGKIIPHYSPASQKAYKDASKAKEYLQKGRATSAQIQMDNIKSGYSALRTTYEYLIANDIIAAVVQRFDPQIRVGRLKEMKFDTALIEEIVQEHAEISDFIEGHLPADEFGILPTCETLDAKINSYERIKTALNNL